MTRLLSAGVWRYLHSTCFWVCFCLSVGTGLFVGYMSVGNYDAYLYHLPLLLCAILCSLTVGGEYANGLFRNKLTVGHTKSRLFFAEALLSLAATTLLYFVHALGFAVFHGAIFAYVAWPTLVGILGGMWLTTLGMGALFVFVSCSVSGRAIAVIINLVLIVCLYFVGFEMDEALREPPYLETVHWVAGEPGEGTPVTKTEPNPDYVGGGMRVALEVLADVSPYGQFFSYESLFSPMLALPHITEDNRPYGTPIYDDFLVTGRYTPPEEAWASTRPLPLYQVGLILLCLGGGYGIFRRKEFR